MQQAALQCLSHKLSLKASFFFCSTFQCHLQRSFLCFCSQIPCHPFVDTFTKRISFSTLKFPCLNLCGKQTKTKNAYRIVDSCVVINVSYFIISSIILLEFLVALSMLSVIWDQRHKNT